MTAWTIFHHPVQWSSQSMLWLLLPLSLAVAIIYKTIRTRRLRRLPLEVAVTTVLMLAGMFALAAGLWLFQKYAI